MKKVTKAVIPCAGFGTRFLPITKSVPKEMLPIVDTPSLDIIVDECINSGITDILIVLGKNKKCIEDFYDYAPELEKILSKGNKSGKIKVINALADKANFYYCRQKEMNGSAMAVLAAESFVGNDPFAVVYGDDIVFNGKDRPAIGQLIDAYYTTGKSILGVQEVEKSEAIKYGAVIKGQEKGRYCEMKGVIEKPKLEELPSTLVSLGRYVLTPDVFDYIRSTQPTPCGEVYLTDTINMMAKSVGVFAYNFEGKRYDTGDKLGYVQANIEYGLRHDEIGKDLAEYIKKLAKEL
ncbi:MAG: UTP--glucose-1-phosphate uridylyltransferase [Clostridia bacterium]|nr:UTP--glucose-1-phosphate uridylyltransferase [Clostridia bacterium]